MSDYEVNTIELDDDHRIVVTYDLDIRDDQPNQWNDTEVHWHCIHEARDYSSLNTDNDPHGDAIDVIVENTEGARYWRDDRDAALAKHFTRAGVEHVVTELWSDRDPAGDYVVYGEPGILTDQIESDIQTMRKWLNGEVYVVMLQQRVRWQRTDVDGTPSRIAEPSERYTWEEVDSIGSVYLDAFDDDEVKKYAAWQFSLEGQYGLPENV